MAAIYRRGKGALRQAAILISVFFALGLVACQGNGGNTVASSEAPTPTATSVAPKLLEPTSTAVPQRESEPESTKPEIGNAKLKETNVPLNRIAYINSNGDLLTINPDGSGLRALTAGVQATAGSAGLVTAQPLNLDRFYAWPTS